jgi:putative transcriptional regulator
MESADLTNHFLIAMPAMADPYFSKSVTYICEHNEQGALGIVINRPIELSLQALLEQVDIPLQVPALAERSIHFGGPVQTDRGFVLHRPAGEWASTLTVGGEIGLTTSKDILEALAQGKGPEQFFITLGYAGWAPGQLEHEIAQNAWLNVPADLGILFDLPVEARFDAAMRLLGLDLANLSEDAGHA